MKKTAYLLLLAALLIVSCIPPTATHAATFSEYNQRDEIQNIVTKAVNAKVSKVSKSDAAKDALTDMATHSYLGNGKTLYLNDGSSVTSAMFQAQMFQEAIVQAMTNIIVQSQDQQLSTLSYKGNISWHDYGDTYRFTAYRGTKRTASQYLGPGTTTWKIHNKEFYAGPKNGCDTAMYLIAGSLVSELQLQLVEAKDTTAVYQLSWRFDDRFDFTTTYYSQSQKGLDTSTDQLLVTLGKLLNRMGAKNFDWEYSWTLNLEVPNSCDHTYGNYRWVYNNQTNTLDSVSGNGFQSNPTMRESSVNTQKETEHFFKLSQTVTLQHDRSWVVEYDLANSESIRLCAGLFAYNYPYIMQSGHDYTSITETICRRLSNSTKGTEAIFNTYRTGVTVADAFQYLQDDSYTYRLENRIAADGSNMIWLSVYHKTTGEPVLHPTPLDEESKLTTGEEAHTLVSENSTRVSGQDILINYVGGANSFNAKSLELRIWENGQNTPDTSAIASTYRAPTCLKPGLTDGLACKLCTAVFEAPDTIPATGHNYADATCETARSCTVCAATEGEALGHSEEILSAVAPTCTESGLTEGIRCTRCSKNLLKQKNVDALGHTWLDATCDTAKTCTVCTAVDGEPLGHDIEIFSAIAPTCTDTGLTEGQRCLRCSKKLLLQQTVEALGHTWLDATCVQPQTCESCGEHQGEALPHRAVTDGAFDPSCTEAGSTGTTSCVDCGHVLAEAESIPATGHKDENNDKACDLCAVSLKQPLSPAILAGIVCAGVAVIALPVAILIRKRKKK